MATIDEDLSSLERDIRQLKIEYDQFFGGGRKRPPSEIEWRIELVVKRYGERGGDMKFAQRFRFSNLSQTYAKYKDIFRKKVQAKEEGKIQRHYGAAAKEIEAERLRKQEESQAAVAASASAEASRNGAGSNGAAANGAGSNGGSAFRVTYSDPARETEKVDQLFQAFVQAKQQAGEETEKLSKSNFNDFVQKKTKDLQKQKNCKEVEYVVETVDGQVKLKALVKA
jgi:hypothetical protein